MSLCKTFGFAIFTAVWLLGETTGSAQAQCDIGPTVSGYTCATEWSGGSIINLGGLPGSTGSWCQWYQQRRAGSGNTVLSWWNIRASRHRVERRQHHQPRRPSELPGVPTLRYQRRRASGGNQLLSAVACHATEWSGGSVINLGGLPGFTDSVAISINDAGQVVGCSTVGGSFSPPNGAAATSSTWEACRAPRIAMPSASTTLGRWSESACCRRHRANATEWSGGNVINLGGLPGFTSSVSLASTRPGRWWDRVLVVASTHATEWSGGNVIELGGLPGFTCSEAVASTTPGRWWERVPALVASAPLSGAAAASSTWKVLPGFTDSSARQSTTPGRWWEVPAFSSWFLNLPPGP